MHDYLNSEEATVCCHIHRVMKHLDMEESNLGKYYVSRLLNQCCPPANVLVQETHTNQYVCFF